jgi:hypothetical protein
MAVPLSIPEQIEAALQARFASIVADGTNYNHTVDACLREPIFHGGCLRKENTSCIYVLSPDSPTEEESELASNQKADTRLRLVLVLNRKFLPKTEAPFAPSLPQRITVQNELERDAKKKIAAELGPGVKPLGVDGVYNIQVTSVDRSMEFTYLEGWAQVRMQILVLFEYVRSKP